jgi:hypothetical protein
MEEEKGTWWDVSQKERKKNWTTKSCWWKSGKTQP